MSENSFAKSTLDISSPPVTKAPVPPAPGAFAIGFPALFPTE